MQDKQQENPKQGNYLDLISSKTLRGLSTTTSRRGFLAAGGRLLLKALGISLVPLLPLDRSFGQFGSPTQDCGQWQYCGQHGRFCAACCGGGPYPTSCPPCLGTSEREWSVCCCCPGCAKGMGYMINYWDCCNVNSGYTTKQAKQCRGATCRRAYSLSAWCTANSGDKYYCTFVSQGGQCGGPDDGGCSTGHWVPW
jgi:hypothetical protein